MFNELGLVQLSINSVKLSDCSVQTKIGDENALFSSK